MAYNLLVILGPTAVGKTQLAARIAARFNGEIISADSRQVYRGMDIGTGKDIADYTVNGTTIPFHLIDIINPDQEYNLFQFRSDFNDAFIKIKSQGKLPVLAGGTGMYLSSVIQNYELKKAEFEEYTDELMNLEFEDLKDILLKLNPVIHNTTDLTDKDRLIKAIIIAKSGNTGFTQPLQNINAFVIGISLDRDIIKTRITERLKLRLKSGMIEEVEALLKSGISHQKLMFFGLEYKFISLYLQQELTYNDMYQKLNSSIHAFAKRQMTWFRKMEKEGVIINWINGPDFEKASNLIIKEPDNFER